MKYVITWTFTPENQKAAIKRFEENSEPMDGIKQIARWHIVGTKRGFRVIETDDPVALSKLSIYWADLLDMKVEPVVDDDEIGKALGD